MAQSSLLNDYTKFSRQQLLDRIEELESLYFPNDGTALRLRAVFNLTRSEIRILGVILSHPGRTITTLNILEILYPNPADRDRGLDAHGNDRAMKTIHVIVHRIRKTLGPFDIRIETVWKSGYTISTKDATRLHELLRENKGA